MRSGYVTYLVNVIGKMFAFSKLVSLTTIDTPKMAAFEIRANKF